LDRLLIPVRDLPLPTRVARCLARLSLERVGDLIRLSPETLLNQPHFGRGSLEVLARVLARLGLGLGAPVEGWPPSDPIALAHERHVEMERELRKLFIPRDTGTLEDELRQLAAPAGSMRNASIVVRHLGWDGRGGATLEAVGREHRISRQRAMALVVRVRRQYLHVRFNPLRLRTCLRLVTPALAEPATAAEDRLYRSGETSGRFRLEGLVTAGEMLHLEPSIEVLVVGGNRVLARRETRGTLLSILGRLREAGRRRGAASFQGVADSLGGRHTVEEVAAVMSLDPRFETLDGEGTWYWFRPEFAPAPQRTRNPIVNRIVKRLGREPEVQVEELGGRLFRWSRSTRDVPPKTVLLGICRRIPWVVVRGGRIALSGS
jgi:hypothetical protein